MTQERIFTADLPQCGGISHRRQVQGSFEGIKKITGKQASRVRVVEDKAGTFLTDQDEVRSRWLEHFRYFKQFYNPVNTIDE